MADPQRQSAPLDAHGIELITRLAQDGADAALPVIAVDGLGDGLPEKVPVGFDRRTQTFRSLKTLIDEWRTAPAVRAGTAKVDTLESFIDLTNRHKDGQSALFGRTRWPEPKLTAVLDYNSADAPARFGKHRIEYAFPLTDEFQAWVRTDKEVMQQDAFAAFLEEHAPELAAPYDGEVSEYERLFNEKVATPSEVLSLSRHLEVFVAARAKQGIRLQTGERVVEFSEEHQNASGQPIVVPGVFIVSVPAFIDGERVRIPARLRYRVINGKVVWFYQLWRWEAFLREQVGHDLKTAAEKTGLPAFEGAPEK